MVPMPPFHNESGFMADALSSASSSSGYQELAEGLGLEPRRASLPFTGFQDRLLANSDIPPLILLYPLLPLHVGTQNLRDKNPLVLGLKVFQNGYHRSTDGKS